MQVGALPASGGTVNGSLTVNGNVGIGTATPDGKLSVEGDSFFRANIHTHVNSSNSPAVLQIGFSRGTGSAPGAVLAGDSIGYLEFAGFNGASYIPGAWIVARSQENFTSVASGTDLEFMTHATGTNTNSTRMVIKDNGYVGIGTSDPGANLEVAGNIVVSGTVDGVDVAGLKSTVDNRVSSYSQFANLNYNSVTVTSSWTKLLTTSGTHAFTKKNADTKIEVYVNSRFSIGAFTGASGIRFQVRIDDNTAPSFGSDGIMLTANSAEYLSLYAVFQNLPAGSHAVSLWAIASPAGSTVASVWVNPGNWGGKIVVKESW